MKTKILPDFQICISLPLKLCGAYLVFFGCRLARGLDLNHIMNYLTWGCRLQQRVHLRLHQGKTTYSLKKYDKIQKCQAIYQKR